MTSLTPVTRVGLLLLVGLFTWEAMAWVYRKEHNIKLRPL